MGHQHERRDDDVPPLTQDDMKKAVKSAIKEWLDEKFAEFGLLSFRALAAAVLAALLLWIAHSNGWYKVSAAAAVIK